MPILRYYSCQELRVLTIAIASQIFLPLTTPISGYSMQVKDGITLTAPYPVAEYPVIGSIK